MHHTQDRSGENRRRSGAAVRESGLMSERFWILKRCDLFDRLDADQLSRLESRSRLRRFQRDEAIYLPGDEADGVLLLTEGRVRICDSTPDGKQLLLAFIEPGELFGEL